jgi:hypothetical protein
LINLSSKKQSKILTREITVSDFDAVAEFLGNGIGYVPEYFLHLLQFMVSGLLTPRLTPGADGRMSAR